MSEPVDDHTRREFLKAAVAVGGTSALSACLSVEGLGGDPAPAPAPTGDPAAVPARQHAWDDVLPRDGAGNVRPPRHHILLSTRLRADGTPTEAAREAVEGTLRDLEAAAEWSNEGLLFTVGYAPEYFARFGERPAGVDLPDPEALTSFEDPELGGDEVVVHLASDRASLVLAAEEALRGNRETVNGEPVGDGFARTLAPVDRRTGFIGAGLPQQHTDVAGIPDDAPIPDEAPLFMGFKSGFRSAQASEDRVTVETGPFAGGTTQHVSDIRLSLDQWYEQDDRFQRVAKMFSPVHAEEGLVEGAGENLGSASGAGAVPDPTETARSHGVAGHAQKAARAREDGEPVLLRRDFDTTDGDQAGLYFLTLAEGIGDFVRTRAAMTGADLAADTAVGTKTNNGILRYITVTRRQNYLVPPRDRRALPTPTG